MTKTVFVDFDDTICLHRHEVEKNEKMFFEKEKACEILYKDSEVNIALYNYLIELKNFGYQVILLSASCSKLFELKKYWLEKNCPLLKFDDYISVSIDINKTQIMLAYVKYKNMKVEDIMLIDDLNIERWSAEKEGIKTLNPQLIMNKKN